MKLLKYLVAAAVAGVFAHHAHAGATVGLPAATGGTVTSVGLALPASILTVSGSPVTSSGTLTGTLATQTANQIWAGPTTGSAATPTFRALVTADMPASVGLLSSPSFTGTPAAPTASPGDSSTQLATDAFVAASFAPLASPALTGTPTVPTATVGTNTTQAASTAFVLANASGASVGANNNFTGTNSFLSTTSTALPSGTQAGGSNITYTAGTFTLSTANTATTWSAIWHGVPTFTDASAGVATDLASESWFGPPVVAGSFTATRLHTLEIQDSTTSSNNITGAVVIATTLGTSATSVGIGAGNINAGGNIGAGGTIIATGAMTALGYTANAIGTTGFTHIANSNSSTIEGSFENSNAGTSTISQIRVGNNTNNSYWMFAGTGFTGSVVTNAPTGVASAFGTASAIPLYLDTNGAAAIGIDGSQNVNLFTDTITFGGSAAATANSVTQFIKNVTAIADNAATTVLTITIPNAAHSATVHVVLNGSLGAGGAIGANEASGTITYDISVTRTAGVNAVAVAATGYGSATASVSGGATMTITAALAAVSGAVGATNTFAFQVTIHRATGSATNHTCTVRAEIQNANATGITLS